MIFFAFRWVLRLCLLVLAVVVLYFGVTAVQVWLTSRREDVRPASAILVMGAAQYDGVPSPDLAARLHQALLLWRAHEAPVIVVTGSKEPGDTYTEAESGAAYLEHAGVPGSDILQAGGRDSWGNVADAAPALRARHDRMLLVVTDPFHEDRSMAIASELGFTPFPAPTRTSPITGWSTLPYFAKETVGVGIGRIIGYQNLDRLHSLVG